MKQKQHKRNPLAAGNQRGLHKEIVMTTSTTSYHSAKFAEPKTVYEFTGVRTPDLQHDISCFMDLRAHLIESDEPEPIKSNSIAYVEAFLDRAITEVELRYSRSKRHQIKRAGNRWRQEVRYHDLRELAQEMKSRLPVIEYLERYVPWAVMEPSGERFRGRCPFPDHVDNTASFVVYPDDSAWCFGCQRGGDLFRVVALIEGIPTFRDQVEYVAELLEPSGSAVMRG